MEIRFLGHAAFELTDGQSTLLIDPFLTGNPKAAASAEELDPTASAACQEVIDDASDDCRAQADALIFAGQSAGGAARREFLAELVRHAADRALVEEVLASLSAV